MYYLIREGETTPCITLSTDDMYHLLACVTHLHARQTPGTTSEKHLASLATSIAANI